MSEEIYWFGTEDQEQRELAKACKARCRQYGKSDANARLIAAAPKMLELIKLVHGSFGGGRTITFSDDDIADFEAVLAEAEGV